MAKPYCNAINCTNLRIRPESTHCPTHEPEWHAIQRDQRHGVTAEIRQRRIAMGMTEFPGGNAATVVSRSGAASYSQPGRAPAIRVPASGRLPSRIPSDNLRERNVRAELLTVFAQSISLKATVAREVELEMREQRRLLESISEDIKKYTDLLPPLVSVGAQAEADRRGVDLRGMGWHDQHRFDRGRSTFQWEHIVPVGQIRSSCLEARNTGEIVQILKTARVAWILKEEDRRLTGLGYRSVRPDPDDAYRAAGITLL